MARLNEALPRRRNLLDIVDALDALVADIPTVELVCETVEATPPDVTETYGTDLGQFWRPEENRHARIGEKQYIPAMMRCAGTSLATFKRDSNTYSHRCLWRIFG